jgi:hypothetical protein
MLPEMVRFQPAGGSAAKAAAEREGADVYPVPERFNSKGNMNNVPA